jgi:hypothetical protein
MDLPEQPVAAKPVPTTANTNHERLFITTADSANK